ncbi:hypothetical protein NUACC26_018490 [Scytonema sp. NUACC26]
MIKKTNEVGFKCKANLDDYVYQCLQHLLKKLSAIKPDCYIFIIRHQNQEVLGQYLVQIQIV